MPGTMNQQDLVDDLKSSLHDAAGVFSEANDGAFKRHLNHAAEDFHRVQPRIRNGALTLVADQSAYAAPADLIRIHLRLWGKAERRKYKPWESLHPGRLPDASVVEGASGREIHLTPAPTGVQIDVAGASYDFLYVAAHVIDAAAENTTVKAHNRGLLLLRAQAEAMKELASRNMHKPVQLRDGVSGAPSNGHPAALYDQLMKRFERVTI